MADRGYVISFQGSYENPTTPLWASAMSGGAIGPNIQVSSITTNSGGAVILDATAPIVFQRPTTAPSIVKMDQNYIAGGGFSSNISIENETGTFYDNLAVGNILLYGSNVAVANTAGAVGILQQHENQTAVDLITNGFYTSSINVSSINGETFPGGNLGPDAEFSTVNINPVGFIRFNANGTSTNFLGGAMFFQKSPDIPQTYSQAIKMAPNILGNILPAETVENISITHVDDVRDPPGIYYDTLALGDLLVYGINNPKSSTIGQLAKFSEWQAGSTDVECITTGFHTSNLVVSTINGLIPSGGGGGGGPNLLVSTIAVNSAGGITMRANGPSSTAGMNFEKVATGTVSLDIKPLVITTANVSTNSEVLAVSRASGFPLITRLDQFALGELLVYGRNNDITSTVGQLGKFTQWSTTSTDLECTTTGFHTSSIIVSTMQIETANISTLRVSSIVDYAFSVSTVATSSITANDATAPIFNASTIKFAPSLGGIDLGLGAFAGAFAGQFASEVLTLSVAGTALATGVIGLIVPRTTNNIYIEGQPSTFQTINVQTQLQYSTLGTATSTFTRYVSSTDGLGGTVVPGQEYIVSSIIAPGTTCIRSFSDPMNLANASTATSSVQSFGFWVPVPNQTTTAFSTVFGDFNVRSTLTAYRANISTSMTVQGAFQAGNITSQGVVAAATNITAGGNVNAFGTGSFTTGLATGGLISGASLNIPGSGGAYISSFVSTYQIEAFDVNAQNIDIGIGNITNINSQNINVANIIGNSATISSFNVSTINGLPYNPGGSGGTLGVFSTVFVSSLTTTSSLTVSGATNVNLLNANSTFTNSISTNQLIANGIGAFSASIGVGTPTLYNSQGIYNPAGQINYGQGIISSIQNNVLWNKVVSTQSLFISSINDQPFPTPYQSTVQGNFYVNSTLFASSITMSGDITARDISLSSDLLANGNITGNTLISQNGVNVISGSVLAPVATIGGVNIGPAGVVSGVLLTGSNLNISSINNAVYPPNTAFSTVNGNFNVRSTLTAWSANISTTLNVVGNATVQNITANQSGLITNNLGVGGTTTTTFLNVLAQTTTDTVLATTRVQTPAIIGLTSINGSPYPPPFISTFNQLYANTISTGQAYIGSLSTSTFTANVGTFVSALQAPLLLTSSISYNGQLVGNNAVIQNVNTSSITVSTINGSIYPPPLSPANPNPTFSTITVSSVATVGSLSCAGPLQAQTITTSGTIAGPNAVLGGVNVGPGGIVSGNVITGVQGNFSGIVRTQAILNPAVGSVIQFGNNITGNFSTVTVDHNLTVRGLLTANTEILTPTLYTQNIFNPTSPFSTINVSGVLKGGAGVNDPLRVLGALSGTIASNQYTNITAGTVVVAGIATGYGATSITGGSVDISRASPTDQALNVNGTVNLQNEVRAPSVNTTINTTGIPLRIGTTTNPIVVPGDTLAGYGRAPFIIGKMLTGQYNFGIGFAFVNGNPYRIPSLRLSPGYACYVKLIYSSRGNVSGNGQQMYGVFDIYVGLTDGVAGVLQPALRQNGIFVQNSSITIYYDPVSGIAEVGIISNVGSGGFGYVVDVSASWTVQPLFTYL